MSKGVFRFPSMNFKGTGPITSKLTPLDSGKCYVMIGVQIDEKTSVQLLSKYFNVKNYPAPPVHISNTISGQSINVLNDSASIIC